MREVVGAAAMAKVAGWTESAARQNALYEVPSHEDAEWADAILFGTRCYFGAMATELNNYLDLLGSQWKRGALAGKVGAPSHRRPGHKVALRLLRCRCTLRWCTRAW